MVGRPVIRVLSVASECAPLVKTGGLADVVGALPAALARQGWDMRVLLPAYRALRGPAAQESAYLVWAGLVLTYARMRIGLMASVLIHAAANGTAISLALLG